MNERLFLKFIYWTNVSCKKLSTEQTSLIKKLSSEPTSGVKSYPRIERLLLNYLNVLVRNKKALDINFFPPTSTLFYTFARETA